MRGSDGPARPCAPGAQVHETKEAGVHVAGLREDIVSAPEQVLALLEAGEAHRHFGETRMNKNSSRSHTIFRMVVESRSRDCGAVGGGADPGDFGAIRVSTLTLVDLAGSERIAKTGAEGQRAKEGAVRRLRRRGRGGHGSCRGAGDDGGAASSMPGLDVT